MRDLTNSQQGSTKKKRNCPKQNSCKISKPYSIETVEFQQFHFPRSKYQFSTELAVGEAVTLSLLHWTPSHSIVFLGKTRYSHSSSLHWRTVREAWWNVGG